MKKTGSSAFIPKEKKDDKQLAYALDLLRGVKMESKETTEKKMPEEKAAVAN